MQKNREIILTKDGSKTIYFPDIAENYHSRHGAFQESIHVFIQNGLLHFQDKKEIRVLEIGFGTGLNACLAFEFALEHKKIIHYDTLEAYPISLEEVKALDYASLFSNGETKKMSRLLHEVLWEEKVNFDSYFYFTKLQQEIQQTPFAEKYYDCVFFDAFAPRVQPELWTIEIFQKMFHALQINGLLVTYCAKGQVKRDLKAAGFWVESVAGPPGKREMTLAWRR